MTGNACKILIDIIFETACNQSNKGMLGGCRNALLSGTMILCLVHLCSTHGTDFQHTLRCRACQPGEFCFQNDLQTCPQHSTSPPQASSIDECVCLDGYKADATHECVPCVPGEYCAGEVATLCSNIGDHMTSQARATVATDCVCAAGYTLHGGLCVACAAGKYKATMGNNECTMCGAGTYSSGTAVTSADNCVACPENSVSADAAGHITHCLCSAGSTGADGGPCALCAKGTYKAHTGSAPCTDCASEQAASSSSRRRLLLLAPLVQHEDSVYYSTTLGSHTAGDCATCPIHSRVLGGASGSSVLDCECDEGYTLSDGGECVMCPPGYFKNVTGSAACDSCPVGTYNSLSRATSDAFCSPCPVLSATIAPAATALDQCQCIPGTQGSAGAACEHCPAGSVSSGYANTVNCAQCPVNTYEVDNECVQCPFLQRTALPGSSSASECVCASGSEPSADSTSSNGVTCSLCTAGYYKEAMGNTMCLSCPRSKYSHEAGAVLCQDCPLGTVSAAEGADNVLKCSCENGFSTHLIMGAWPSCSQCSPISVSEASLQDIVQYNEDNVETTIQYPVNTCVECPANTFPQDGQCAACPARSASQTPLSSAGKCTCDAGYTCIPETFATQKIETHSNNVHAGKNFIVFTATSHVDTSDSSGRAVMLRTTTELRMPLHVPVVLDWGSTANTCPVTLSRTETSYIAPSEVDVTLVYNEAAQTTTVVVHRAMPLFVACATSAPDISLVGSALEITACPCMPCSAGFYKTTVGNTCFCAVSHGAVCTECARSSRIDGGCVACPLGHYSSALLASTDCVPCPQGSYLGHPAAACETCPAHSTTSSTGATTALDCMCEPGYEPQQTSIGAMPDTALSCSPCPASYYKEALGNEVCTQCDATSGLTTTQQGATSVDSCTACQPGYFLNMTNGIDGRPVSICVECVATNCECPPGHTGNGQTQCEPCASGTYKASTGSHACSQCGAGLAGKATVGNENATSACMACTNAEYATNNGCLSCGAHKQSPRLATKLGDCLCAAGHEPDFIGLTEAQRTILLGQGFYECVPCAAGTFKSSIVSSACTTCNANFYSDSIGSTACSACPDISVQHNDDARTSVLSCVCPIGHYQNSAPTPTFSGCETCPQGTFAGAIGSYSCARCTAGKYYNVLGSGNHDTTCTACPGNSSSLDGAFLIADCICNAGYARDGAVCTACQQNTSEQNDICIPCPQNSAHDIVASALLSDCTCHDGFWRNTTDTCQACPVDAFCTGNALHNCADARRLSSTQHQAKRFSIDHCICDAGTYLSIDDECTTCPAQHFCMDNALNSCPLNSNSLSGSGSAAECVCEAGYKRTDDTCELCAVDEICDVQYLHTISLNSTIAGTASNASVQATLRYAFPSHSYTLGTITTTLDIVHTARSSTIMLSPHYNTQILSAANNMHHNVQPSASTVLHTEIRLHNIAPANGIAWVRAVLLQLYDWHTLGADTTSQLVRMTSKASPTQDIVLASTPSPSSGSGDTYALRSKQGRMLLAFADDSSHVPSDDSMQKLSMYTASIAIDTDMAINAASQTDGETTFFFDTDSVQQTLAAELSTHSPSLHNTEIETRAQYKITHSSTEYITADSLTQVESYARTAVASTASVGSQVHTSSSVNVAVAVYNAEPSTVTSVDTNTHTATVITQSTQTQKSASLQIQLNSIDSMPTKTCVYESTSQDGNCVCADGFFCSDLSSSNSASVITDCVQRSSHTLQCLPCPEGSYCNGNMQRTCQPNAQTSQPQSGTAADCTCNAGYAKRQGTDTCWECGVVPDNSLRVFAQHYCPAHSNDAVECKQHDSHLVQSYARASTVAHCICAEGHYRLDHDDACKPCPRDFFCPTTILAGTVPTPTPEDALAYVFACPANAHTESTGVGSYDECQCKVGFKVSIDETQIGTCLACDANELCRGFLLDAETANVVQCMPGQVPAEDHTRCVCAPGYTYASDVNLDLVLCEPCPPGHIQPLPDQSECIPCSKDTYHNNIAGAPQQCTPCPPNMETTAQAHTACTCKAPYVTGSTGTCVLCGQHEYFDAHLQKCMHCPSHSSNAAGQGTVSGLAVCICDAGYERLDEDSAATDGLCRQCPGNTFEWEGVCYPCGHNAQSVAGSSGWQGNCECQDSDQFYLWDFLGHTEHVPDCYGVLHEPTLQCTICDAGTSNNINDRTSECTACDYGSYSIQQGQATCTQCASHKNTHTPGNTYAGACECSPGYEMHVCTNLAMSCGDTCGPCPTNRNDWRNVSIIAGDQGTAVLAPQSLASWERPQNAGEVILFSERGGERLSLRQIDVATAQVTTLCSLSPPGHSNQGDPTIIKVGPDGSTLYVVDVEYKSISTIDMTGSPNTWATERWVGAYQNTGTDEDDGEGTNAYFHKILAIDFVPDGSAMIVVERDSQVSDPEDGVRAKIRRIALNTGLVTTIGLVVTDATERTLLKLPRSTSTGMSIAPDGESIFLTEGPANRIWQIDISSMGRAQPPPWGGEGPVCQYVHSGPEGSQHGSCDIIATLVAESLLLPTSLQLSPDSTTLLIGGETGLHMLTLPSHAVSTLEQHKRTVVDAIYSSDGLKVYFADMSSIYMAALPPAYLQIDLQKLAYVSWVDVVASDGSMLHSATVKTSNEQLSPSIWTECKYQNCESALVRHVYVALPNSPTLEFSVQIGHGLKHTNCGNLARSCGESCELAAAGAPDTASCTYNTAEEPLTDGDSAQTYIEMQCTQSTDSVSRTITLGQLAYIGSVQVYVSSYFYEYVNGNLLTYTDTNSIHVYAQYDDSTEAQCTLDNESDFQNIFIQISGSGYIMQPLKRRTYMCENKVAHKIRISRVCNAAEATGKLDVLYLSEVDVSGRLETPEHAWFPCLPCALGHAKATLSNALCEACPVAEFADTPAQHECTRCDAAADRKYADSTDTHGTGSTSSDNCTCTLGLGLPVLPAGTPASDTCEECPVGSYKDFKGTEPCLLCGLCHGCDESSAPHLDFRHHYGNSAASNSESSHCQQCPPNSGQDPNFVAWTSLMDDVDDCLCMPAFERQDGNCVNCPEYQFKVGYGNEPCTLCNAKYYFTLANQRCAECSIPQHQDPSKLHKHVFNEHLAVHEVQTDVWGTGAEDCQCNMGFVKAESDADNTPQCFPCPPGQHKDTLASWACAACTEGKYSNAAGTVHCTSCPANASTFATEADSILKCVCEGGFDWDEDTEECSQCAVGKFRADPFDAPDTPASCKEDTTACLKCQQCDDTFYQDTTGQIACKACPENTVASTGGRNNIRHCECSPGYGIATSVLEQDPGECQVCAAGTYSLLQNYFIVDDGHIDFEQREFQQKTCTNCPANMLTDSDRAHSPTQCLCNAGYEPSSTEITDDNVEYTTACTQCPLGKYKSQLSNAKCTACGILSQVTTESTGSISYNDCMCNAQQGYFEGTD